MTHDRHLIDRVASRVLEIHDGELLNHLSAARYWEARDRAAAGAGDVPRRRALPSADARSRRRRPRAASRRPRRPAPPRPARPRSTAEEARRRRARLRGVEAAVLRAEKRLGEIDAELAEPETYADRDVLNRLLDERGIVEGQLQREYRSGRRWSTRPG